jgi:NAD(P)H-hydrate epimerase
MMTMMVLNDTWAKQRLQPRPRTLHKHQCGHVLVVGGDQGMGGAVRLAAEAAMRVGAGLVTVMTHPEHSMGINSTCASLMMADFSRLTELFDAVSVIVLGPGLRESEWSLNTLDRVLSLIALFPDKPILIDGGALRFLQSYCQARLETFRPRHWILTPHPGEAAALLGRTASVLPHEREMVIRTLQQDYACIVVLKGFETLIAGPEETLWRCPLGNPGMATAGMGDVLSGVIAGLWGQGHSALESAGLGVYIHARAADEAVLERGERGLLAQDVLLPIRGWVNRYAHAY